MDKLILTNSSIMTWRACKRKYFYAYVMQIISKGINMAFYTGTLLHHMVNDAHTTRDLDKTMLLLRSHCSDLLVEYVSMFHTLAEDEDLMRSTNNLVETACEGYFKMYGGKMPTPVAIEQVLSYTLSPDVILISKIDEIIKHPKKKNGCIVYEIKSAKQVSPNYIKKYIADHQTMTYVIVADMYYDITGVTLDCIKKPGIHQGKKENDTTFYTRLMSLYLDDTVNHFYTETFPLNTRTIKEHLRSLRSEASVIAQAHESGKERDFPCNFGACYNYTPCVYLPLCLNGINDNMLRMFMKKPVQHMELPEIYK